MHFAQARRVEPILSCLQQVGIATLPSRMQHSLVRMQRHRTLYVRTVNLLDSIQHFRNANYTL